MKKLSAAVLLGLAFAASPAFADYDADARNLDIGMAYSNGITYDMDLIADTGTSASIRIFGLFMGGSIGQIPPYNYTPGRGVMAHDSGMYLNVRDGWRITSMTFSASATGFRNVANPPAGLPAGEVPTRTMRFS